MKKLSKLKIKEFREMSDFEMKHVLGGSGSIEGGGTDDLGGGSGVTHRCDLICTHDLSFKAYDCDSVSSASACEYYGETVVSCTCPE